MKKQSNFFTIPLTLLLCFSCADKPSIASEGTVVATEIPIISCAAARYDDWEQSDYVLPYPVGKSYLISLAHCGGSYHAEGLPDQYATDFAIDIGTLVTASRDGVVVFVEESGIDGLFPNNLVIVEHSDGTFGQYMHLTTNGALVEKGEKVLQGQEIGLSGNTGLAGFPHLHFVVTKSGNYNYPYQSIPMNFRNTLANERGLAPGERYPAYEY